MVFIGKNGVVKRNQKENKRKYTKRSAKFVERDDIEEQGLDKIANNVSNCQEATAIICRYKENIKTQNKKAIGHTGKQGELLKKFQDNENFFDNVGQSRSTIYFKISLYKLLRKYHLLKTSILQSSYFKNNFKAIKIICKKFQLYIENTNFEKNMLISDFLLFLSSLFFS